MLASRLMLILTLTLLGANALRIGASEAAHALWAPGTLAESFAARHRLEIVAPEWRRPSRELLVAYLQGATAARDADARRALWGLAASEAARGTSAEPVHPEPYTALAVVRDAEGDRPGAVKAAWAAATLRPGSPRLAWQLAARLPADHGERARWVRRVTALEPAFTPAVAAALGATGLRWQQGIDSVTPSAAAYRAWAWAEGVTDAAVAIAYAGLALAALPGDAVDRGWLAYLIGLRTLDVDPLAAEPWLRRACAQLPEEQACHRNLGFALLKSGEPAGAAQAFARSLELEPDVANAAHLGLAQAEEDLGRPDAALARYRRLMQNPRLEAWVRTAAADGEQRIENKRLRR